MNHCKIIYLASTILYSYSYYSGSSWIHPEETFAWPRMVFLVAILLLMEKYDLVPKPLSCPPMYIIYKVVAAIISANIALVTVWWQVEDFLKWALASFAGLFEYMPLVNQKLSFGEDPNAIFYLQLAVAVYFMIWVLNSSGYLPRFKRGSRADSGCPPTPTSGAKKSMRRRSSRVNVRC